MYIFNIVWIIIHININNINEHSCLKYQEEQEMIFRGGLASQVQEQKLYIHNNKWENLEKK